MRHEDLTKDCADQPTGPQKGDDHGGNQANTETETETETKETGTVHSPPE